MVADTPLVAKKTDRQAGKQLEQFVGSQQVVGISGTTVIDLCTHEGLVKKQAAGPERRRYRSAEFALEEVADTDHIEAFRFRRPGNHVPDFRVKRQSSSVSLQGLDRHRRLIPGPGTQSRAGEMDGAAPQATGEIQGIALCRQQMIIVSQDLEHSGWLPGLPVPGIPLLPQMFVTQCRKLFQPAFVVRNRSGIRKKPCPDADIIPGTPKLLNATSGNTLY